MIEKKKEFDFSIDWTDRKLKNIEAEAVVDSILNKLKLKTTPALLKLVLRAQELITRRLCDDYSYTPDDNLLIREGLKIYSSCLTLKERKLVERFERANNIKTVWRNKKDVNNTRGQNFNLILNE